MTVELITKAQSKNNNTLGQVALVGAGPGDPELLTLKALKAIENADLILFDNLVSHEIRALFPTHTKAIYVGKKKADHCIPQDQLNLFMVDKAKQGLNICRLKGGDPFVFGRGSEEQLVLHAHDIKTIVVPGVTAASGCTAYAGIPLTHRGLSTGCTFITGHLKNGQLDLNWSQLAHLEHTLVFYMGLGKLAEISAQLISHGLASDTPAALIENGSTLQQREFVGTVVTLPALAIEHQLQSPSLIVIGKVVSLAEQLSWRDLEQAAKNQELSA
ncbi:uroporphyrinogen-III C-methyltransferase [Moritella viscosa]|uniref:uroporphyrinogen-III C-methyltransferase n=1 Tax=Moritella viscosa TaxID=80854 RepID=A0ABY1HCW5_9GAMM|nr:uroporphyrinogen-III C-methyltransferase [Moritella viscosa]CED62000.1 siroheme synthase [Moritella viscosa]SGY91795.1 Putative uroporphyrin-III C-methyltransferase [Moritella viscosa]SGY96131.1 Putative uroporphyrin-III C-methyltransferase [Moritella viscosa]SGZ02088.1 Putative uroporphyrin-III C-methyltransferase [Moritella viscosa]SHO07896.1 Putative uroporphyrin-III C-methyltransferase [Moritella viscosa]